MRGHSGRKRALVVKPMAAAAFLGAALLCFALPARAVRPHSAQLWQTLQDLSTTQIAREWNDPSSVYGPEPYYGLNGPVSVPQIERDLDTMKRLGFRAVTVQAGYNMPFAYLSPRYFAFFRSFVAEAKQRDMRVWIVDDAGYPSGFAGGLFSTRALGLRMQALAVTQTIPVSGGNMLHHVLPEDAVSAAAVNASGRVVVVPLRGNVLDWTAPAGTWTVMIVEHVFRTSPTRSDTNPTRAKDSTQSLEDYLNPVSTRQFLTWTHEKYRQYLGAEFGKTILGFRGDEPDFSISGLPWTQAFFQEFRRIKGYNVEPYTALFAYTPPRHGPALTIQLTPRQQGIKADYYDVFSQMFAAGFFKPLGDWCAAHHLEYQVHLNHEEQEMELTHSEGSFFRDMRSVEVPGIDAIWHQIWPDTISDYPRLASSVAHVYGHPRAFTESFAAYRPEPDVAMARYILNEEFVRGVNLVEMMYFPATSSGPRPPPSFMGEPAFPALTAYVRRMSYLLSVGRPDASVALFLPSDSMWMGDADADTQFVSTERLLSEHQIDFDIVSEDALARDLKAGKGSFATQSGNRYHAVILPAPAVLSAATVTRLKTFAAGGGSVFFLGGTPRLIAGRTFRDARDAAPAEFAWANVLSSEQLPPTPTPPQFPPATVPQPQAVPDAILTALHTLVPVPTITLDTPDTAIRVMKRRWRDADVYLIFNEGSAVSHHAMTLMSRGSLATQWDAQTGTSSSLMAKNVPGGIRVVLPLQPYQAKVVVVADPGQR